MEKLFICLFFVLATGSVANGQKGKTNDAHIGVIYPLSTNGQTAAQDTNNFSLHLIAGVSQQENTFLLSGVVASIRGDAYGAVISGVANCIGNQASGIQVAGVLNRVRNEADGAQLAGLANITGSAQGIQVAGLFNQAGDANVQIAGLFNKAKSVKGVQIAGLLNIAEESSYPIGLINVVKNGEMLVGVNADESGSILASLRSGGRVLYGVVGLGYNVREASAQYIAEGGIGAHLLGAKAFRARVELASAVMTNFEDGVYGRQSMRAFAAYRIIPRLEIFAGPTINHLIYKFDQVDIRDDRYQWRWEGDDYFNGVYFGGMVGVQFSL